MSFKAPVHCKKRMRDLFVWHLYYFCDKKRIARSLPKGFPKMNSHANSTQLKYMFSLNGKGNTANFVFLTTHSCEQTLSQKWRRRVRKRPDCNETRTIVLMFERNKKWFCAWLNQYQKRNDSCIWW